MNKSPKFAGYVDPTFFFNWVDHPGVEARLYMQLAAVKTRNRIREIIKNEVKMALRSNLRSSIMYHKDEPIPGEPQIFKRRFFAETIPGGEI